MHAQRQEAVSIGIALGALIGLVSAVPYAMFVRTGSRLFKKAKLSIGDVGAIAAELFTIPAFWFGGHWASSVIIRTVNWQEMMEPYVLSLAVTFGLPSLVLTVLFVAKTAQEIFEG